MAGRTREDSGARVCMPGASKSKTADYGTLSTPMSQSQGKLRAGDPGTFQHIAANPLKYSFRARMKATEYVNMPPDEDVGVRPVGYHMICCNMFCCCL